MIVDEAPPFVRLIQLELGFQGFKTASVLIDEGVIQAAVALQPDAVVLGSAIPTPALFDVLAELARVVSSPVIFIHALGNETDGAVALELGAADVLSRPFKPEELGLRLRAVLGHVIPETQLISRGRVSIDVLHRLVSVDGRQVFLGTTEWSLLLALANSPDPVLAAELLTEVWGRDYVKEERFLRVWIDRLRANLGDDPGKPSIITGDMQSGFELAG